MPRESDIEKIKALKDTLPPELQRQLIDSYGDSKNGMEQIANNPASKEAKPSKQPTGQKPESTLKLIRMSDVEAKDVEWLWKPYIPLGKITLIQGDPGQGKTTLSLALASIVSNGHAFPNSEGFENIEPGNVIYQTAEDGLDDTIKPRLIKAGADCTKILVIDEKQARLSLVDPRIEQALTQVNPKLMIIDPLQAYLGGSIDMHRANEVRPILSHLGNLADKYNCAIVIIMHMSKAAGVKGLYRGLGSIDIPATSRSILLVGSNPNDEREKAIVHIKSNLALAGKVVGFQISDEKGIMWNPSTFLTEDIILRNKSVDDKEMTAEDDAIDFLKYALSGGEMESKEIKTMSKQEGISERTLYRAKDELRVNIRRAGKGKNSLSYWSLPQNTPKIKPNVTNITDFHKGKI